MKRWVKLSEYAKLIGYRYITVWKNIKKERLPLLEEKAIES